MPDSIVSEPNSIVSDTSSSACAANHSILHTYSSLGSLLESDTNKNPVISNIDMILCAYTYSIATYRFLGNVSFPNTFIASGVCKHHDNGSSDGAMVQMLNSDGMPLTVVAFQGTQHVDQVIDDIKGSLIDNFKSAYDRVDWYCNATHSYDYILHHGTDGKNISYTYPKTKEVIQCGGEHMKVYDLCVGYSLGGAIAKQVRCQDA